MFNRFWGKLKCFCVTYCRLLTLANNGPMQWFNESKVTSAGSFFNFAGFADHAGQCCSQTLLNKTCCVLFCVLSRRYISHRSFDGDA